jgi:hypothetical protein
MRGLGWQNSTLRTLVCETPTLPLKASDDLKNCFRNRAMTNLRLTRLLSVNSTTVQGGGKRRAVIANC